MPPLLVILPPLVTLDAFSVAFIPIPPFNITNAPVEEFELSNVLENVTLSLHTNVPFISTVEAGATVLKPVFPPVVVIAPTVLEFDNPTILDVASILAVVIPTEAINDEQHTLVICAFALVNPVESNSVADVMFEAVKLGVSTIPLPVTFNPPVVILFDILAVPDTSNLYSGLLVPIPTFP